MLEYSKNALYTGISNEAPPPRQGINGYRSWTSLLIIDGEILREQEKSGQLKIWWNIIHRCKCCFLHCSSTLRRYNALEVHLLIIHSKEPGVITRERLGHAD